MQSTTQNKLKLSILDQFKLSHSILALDVSAMRAHFERNGWDIGVRTDKEILAAIHTMRLALFNATPAQKGESETWLRQNMYEIPEAIKNYRPPVI